MKALIAKLTHSVPSIRLAATGYHIPTLPWVQGCCPTIQPGREMGRERQENPELCSWIQWQQGHLFQPIKFVFVKLKLQIVFGEDIYAAFRASVVQVFRGTLTAGWGWGQISEQSLPLPPSREESHLAAVGRAARH